MSVHKSGQVLQLTIFLFVTVTALAAQCTSPQVVLLKPLYRSHSLFIANAAIAPDNFNRADLLCLGKDLKRRFSRYPKISVEIFNNPYAAEHITRRAYTIEAREADLALKDSVHADFEFNSKTGDDYVLLYPQGNSTEFQMRIDLGDSNLPDCTIVLGGRCLVEFAQLTYPPIEWRRLVSGSVTVRGVIATDGSVRNARVVHTNVNVPAGLATLKQTTLSNFRTWYFERQRSPNQSSQPTLESIEVTYRYVLSGKPEGSLRTKLQFTVPNTVLITATPPLEGQRE